LKKTHIITADGSSTIRWENTGECYHSTFGAITESKYIFINQGFSAIPDTNPLRILEVGMGTGLNVLLTCCQAVQEMKTVYYHALEPFPLESDVWKQLNYAGHIPFCESDRYFTKIHSGKSGEVFLIAPGFKLLKDIVGIHEAVIPEEKYELVYYDAFSPDTQPEMWNENALQKVHNSLTANGLFLTYTVKGEVKRTLKAIGFEVEILPGPPGKRHIMRARKPG